MKKGVSFIFEIRVGWNYDANKEPQIAAQEAKDYLYEKLNPHMPISTDIRFKGMEDLEAKP